MTAVDPPSISPYSASTGSPSGPRTRRVRRSPRVAATRASTVPSPPSAIGTSTTSASEAATRTPSAIASAASSADSEPLNALGAMTRRISPSPAGVRRRSVDGRQPVTVLGAASPHDLEIELLQPLDHWPHLAITDRPTVDIDHGRYLRAGAAKEDLIGDIELRAVDGALHDLQVELSAQQLDHGESGQTFQDVVRGGRCKHLAVADQEDVLGAAFADMTVVGQH